MTSRDDSAWFDDGWIPRSRRSADAGTNADDGTKRHIVTPDPHGYRMSAVVVGHDDASNTVAELLRPHVNVDCDVYQVDSFLEVFADRKAGIDGAKGKDGSLGRFPNLALITVLLDEHTNMAELVDFFKDPTNSAVRLVCLTTQRELDGIGDITSMGLPDLICYVPDFVAHRWLSNIDDQLRRHQQLSGNTVTRSTALSNRFILDSDLTDVEIVEKIIQSADEILGYQPRVHYPPGVKLTVEGKPVEEIYIALSGRVLLERSSDAGSITMHHASTGRIIGLLALTRGKEAYFTSRTTTDVTAVQLTFEQLNQLMELDRQIAPMLASLFIRSLHRRLRRSEDIQVEKVELASELEHERAALAKALRNLEAAREELTIQARFASLGELAAGVAHELNNPMAAIERTAEHLGEDVHNLIESSGDRKWMRRTTAALDAAGEASAMTTKDARRLRNELAEVTKDQSLAQRLVLAGVRDRKLAKEIMRSRSTSFETIETAASIGSGLRNLRTASKRITELVASLRAYARPDGDPITDIDIHETIEDTLRLLAYRLRQIEISRNFKKIPRIAGHPGQLSQVWTNLITNAAEALLEENPDEKIAGTICIETRSDEDWVQVRVIDDGPGIPDDMIGRLFEPRFTTKNGQVRFGMGIGLGVCRSIVQKHSGTLTIDSSPEGTTVTVRLPTDGPLAPQEEIS